MAKTTYLTNRDRFWVRRNRRRGPPGPQGIEGDMGPQGPQGEEPSEAEVSSIVSTWITAHHSEFIGPQGPKGDKGDSGTNGTNGSNGATGPAGPDRVKFAKTLSTNSSGLWTGTVPSTATVLLISPRTFGAIQQTVTQVGTTVTIQFQKLNTGGLGLTLGTLLSATILASSVGVVSFDLVAMEPTP